MSCVEFDLVEPAAAENLHTDITMAHRQIVLQNMCDAGSLAEGAVFPQTRRLLVIINPHGGGGGATEV